MSKVSPYEVERVDSVAPSRSVTVIVGVIQPCILTTLASAGAANTSKNSTVMTTNVAIRRMCVLLTRNVSLAGRSCFRAISALSRNAPVDVLDLALMPLSGKAARGHIRELSAAASVERVAVAP